MSQTLNYKGYDGAVLFSAEDKLLHGRIMGIRDAVTYEGTDVRGLEKSFREAVDEYLRFCEAENKPADRPFKGTFNVRVGSDLHKRAALHAEAHHSKLNQLVQEALEQYLSQAS